LQMAAMMWPTPNVPNGGRSVAHVTDWRGKSAYHNGKKVQVGLESAVRMWATPTASTGGPEPAGTTGRKLVTQVGGQLNPTWVEWLMGWPLGWTDLQPLEMDKYQPVRLKHTAG
jgi:DNA (cytosine-5)-methyltransferase 1